MSSLKKSESFLYTAFLPEAKRTAPTILPAKTVAEHRFSVPSKGAEAQYSRQNDFPPFYFIS